ncbi:MAG: hypothetical protein Q9159_006602 [Coniocarpon cinnabarinum]
MADSNPTAEPPNGESKVSKNALAKAAKKAEKEKKKAEHQAQAAAEKAAGAQSAGNAQTKDLPTRPKQDVAPAISLDHDPMDETFKVGWLAETYKIAPVGPQVTTRFPPEPNGYLHVGHAKAIAVNFGFAKFYGGKCYLRYDDTNPEKEEEQYFTSIRETVKWLGYKPYDITHSSDRFDRLYQLAEILIERGGAYVCHCTQAEIQKQKGGKEGKENPRYACTHRDRPSSESLHEFRRMRDGHYAPKTAVLRMKQDLLGSGNPYMWDMPAYRIPDNATPHHKTGSTWRIYPTYDFTHCLCDAMESISHSLCTVEFRTARESYDWLVDRLKNELPAVPQQREYGRLNVTGTVLSKRKILELVNKKIVRGWDDPRLYTIIALRRRGIPPGAIRAFVADLGVSDSLSTIQTVRLETVVRKYLERSIPRLFLIPDPVKIVLTNLPENHLDMVSVDFLKGSDPATFGSHQLPFTRVVYVDRSDFRAAGASADFFRLAVGQPVGLLHVPQPIVADSFDTDATTGNVTEVRATYLDPSISAWDEKAKGKLKPKAFIQWVADSPAHKSPLKAEVRIFHPLFKSLNPDAHPDGYLQDINPKSEEIFPNACLEVGFHEIARRAPWPKDFLTAGKAQNPWEIRFQGVRVAYFAVDSDSILEPDRALAEDERERQQKIVLNQIVALKEDAGKGSS